MHLDMALALFPALREVHHWTRSGRPLVEALPDGIALVAHETPMAACLAAEVSLTCTSSPEPLLGPEAMRSAFGQTRRAFSFTRSRHQGNPDPSMACASYLCVCV